MKPRIAIVGSREGVPTAFVNRLVNALHRHYNGEWTLVSGGARGVDRDAEYAAFQLGVERQIWPADWDAFGKSAGYRRNKQIVANSDIVYALFADGPKSKGTSHTVELATKTNKRLHVHHEGIWESGWVNMDFGL